MVDRVELARTFEQAATRYHNARPRYPDALYDRLFELTGLRERRASGAWHQKLNFSVLEVGCATGIATEVLARSGAPIVALEPGPSLAAEARQNLASWPGVSVVEATFENWAPPNWHSFDLVVAATSWHWTDPDVRYSLAARHLRTGGHLAFWTAAHVVPDGGDRFFAEIQDVYDDIGESMPGDAAFARPGELADQRADIEESGLFETIGIRHFDWEVRYDAERYIDLLSTFSGHIAMPERSRNQLFREIRRRLGDRGDPTLRRHWGAVLHVARTR